MSTAPHCLVVGVGPGLGMGCVRRFAADGYRVSMIARHAGRLASVGSGNGSLLFVHKSLALNERIS